MLVMEMSNKKQQIPAIRFNGFTDAWEQRKLGELLTEVKRPIKMKDDECYELVTVKRRNEGIVSRGIFRGKDVLVKSQFQIKTGDYLISKRQVVHGANGIVPSHLNNAIVSNEYLVSIGNKNITTDFLTIISRLPSMYRKFFLSSYGIDIEKLVFNVEDWKKRTIRVPGVSEQNQISIFYKQIDSTIALHQRQLNNYKQLKRSLVKKIFSQEIRFKDESGNDYTEWMYKKLVDLCDYMGDGDWIESKDQSSDGVRLIQTGNVGIGIYFDKFDKAKYITQETFEQLKCTEVFEGDILVSRLPDPAGRACIVPKLPYEKLVTAVDCTIIRANSITSNQYLLQCMSTDNYFQKIKKEIAGGTRLRISRKNLEQITFPAPCREEQQKIADFLTIFDTKIEKANQKIELLKDQKKRFMQQMFT